LLVAESEGEGEETGGVHRKWRVYSKKMSHTLKGNWPQESIGLRSSACRIDFATALSPKMHEA